MKEKNKIIFIGKYETTKNLYAVEKVSKQIFFEHSKNELTEFICYFDDGKLFSFSQKCFGYKVEKVYNNGRIIRMGIFPFVFYLSKNRHSVIHIISFEKLGLIVYIFKFVLRLKIIYTLHGIDQYEGNYFLPEKFIGKHKLLFTQFIYSKYSDYYTVQSGLYKNLINKFYNINTKKIFIIPNGIDKIFYDAATRKTDCINNQKDFIAIVFIANPKRENKGFEFIKNILVCLKVKFKFYIICDKSERIDAGQDLNINYIDNMNTPELVSFLLDKDVLFVPSKIESFNIPAIECMTLGMICIITEKAGASEYVKNNYNGFVIEYGDVQRSLEILNEIFNNENMRLTISTNARKIYEKLNWQSVYLNYYSKLYDFARNFTK